MTKTQHPVITTSEGVTRQVLDYNDDLMLVKFTFDKGGVGAPHHHEHIQSTFVTKGQFLFTVSGVETLLNAGDSIIIPSNAVHSSVALEDGILIDNFTPKRDDFL